MSHSHTRWTARRTTRSVLLLGLVLLSTSLLSAQEDTPTVKRKAPLGRLPAHYAKVVAPDQKEKIYAIQKEFAPRMKALRDQLAALQAERDAKCREILTPEQQKKVDELTAAAKAERDAEKATTEASAVAEPPVTRKPTAKASGN